MVESTCQSRRHRFWTWRSPGGNDNPLQYSCLENSMDRGARQAIVHGIAKSRHDCVTGFHFHLSPIYLLWWSVCSCLWSFHCVLHFIFYQWEFLFYFIFNWRIIIILQLSATHQHESAIGIHMSPSLEPPSHLLPNPTPLVCHRAPVWIPWVREQIPIGHLFYTW